MLNNESQNVYATIEDIEKIKQQIEELKINIKKKEDDLKNVINEKVNEINELEQKLLDQENKIKNNEIEIKILDDKIDNLKKRKIINKTSLYDSNGLERIQNELKTLEHLENSYGFLSSMGVKIIKSRDIFNIEGFIKAPNNSPYKNGIFKFLIKLDKNYPKSAPDLLLKTKIFHTMYNESRSHCAISLLNNWNPKNNLIQVLCSLYEFFTYQTNFGYCNEAYRLFHQHNIHEFNKKCQEYVIKYSYKDFSKEYNYLFEEHKNNIKREFDNDFIFVSIENSEIYKMSIDTDEADKPAYYYIGHYIDPKFADKALITDNKVFHSSICIKQLSNRNIIFLAPILYEYSSYIRKEYD